MKSANNIQTDFSLPNSFLKEFSHVVNKYGERVALVIENISFTYTELQNHIIRVREIIDRYKIINTAIGIAADSSIMMHASVIAIIQSGNTVLPFNIKHPVNRLKKIFDQSNPSIIFIFSPSDERIDNLVDECSVLPFFSFHFDKLLNTAPPVACKAEYVNIAYILFTSGSTGEPKGVPITNTNLNYLLNYFLNNEKYNFTIEDRFLQVFEPTFDVFYFSFLVPILLGASSYVLSQKSNLPKYMLILDMLNKCSITVFSMVSSTLVYMDRFLDELTITSLRYSFFTGDALNHNNVVKWQQHVPNTEIYNLYGPTEATIFCTAYKWELAIAAKENFQNIIPLGKPFPLMNYLLVNENNMPVNAGEKGELCFSGVQVADHYINNINEHSFFYLEKDNVKYKYYKTGDIANVNEYGNIIFLGRKDYQVKINGHRVELQEVEQVLFRIINLPVAAVAFKNKHELYQIILFVETSTLNESSLMTQMAMYLPDYMMPKKIMPVKKMPVNVNNKIDKISLKAIALNM
jgi:D-alanine--poly(phosphoribitol) ligase subunit 1